MLIILFSAAVLTPSSGLNSPQFCTLDGNCCFFTQTGLVTITNVILNNQYSFSYGFAYSSVPTQAILTQRHAQLYRSTTTGSSTTNFSMLGTQTWNANQGRVSISNMDGVTNICVEFLYMISTQFYFFLLKNQFQFSVGSSNINYQLAVSGILYSNQSSIVGSMFLTWFRMVKNVSFGFYVEDLRFPQVPVGAQGVPRFNCINPYQVTIDRFTVFIVLYNQKRFSNSQSLNYYTHYTFQVNNFNTITDQNHLENLDELKLSYSNRIASSTIYGSRGMKFQIGVPRTHSIGYDLQPDNTVSVTALNGHSMFLVNSLRTDGYFFSLFAMYQKACTSGLFLTIDRTTCVSACAANQYSYCSYCMSCHFSCGSCTGALSTLCLTCAPNRIFNANSCTQCIPDAILVGNNCLICNSQCRTCSTAASNCTSCYPGYYHQFYPQTCLPCDPTCLQCSAPSDPGSCQACRSQLFLHLVNQSCLCLTDFFPKDNRCLKCDVLCAICSLDPSNCVSCAAGWNLARKENGFRSCVFCNPDKKERFEGNSCICAQNYSLYEGECLFYGMRLTQSENSTFFQFLGLAGTFKTAQSVAISFSLAFGANFLLMGFVVDSLMLRMHLLARGPIHYQLRLFLMALYSQSTLPFMSLAGQFYSNLTSPGPQYDQPEANIFMQTQFGDGRGMFQNLFDILQDWLLFVAGVLPLLLLTLLSKLLLVLFANSQRVDRVSKTLFKRLSRFPVQCFVMYSEGLIGLVNVALAQVTTRRFGLDLYFASNYLSALLILTSLVTIFCRIFISFWNNPPSKAHLKDFLLYFGPKFKRYQSLHTSVFLTLSLRMLVLPCLLYFLQTLLPQMLAVLAYNTLAALQVYFCRKALKHWLTTFIVLVAFTFLQICILGGGLAYHIEATRTPLALAGMACAVIIVLANLVAALIQLKENAVQFWRLLLKLSRSQIQVHSHKHLKLKPRNFKKFV